MSNSGDGTPRPPSTGATPGATTRTGRHRVVRRLLTLVVVLAVIAAGTDVGLEHRGLLHRWTHDLVGGSSSDGGGSSGPATVPPPAGLSLPAVRTPAPVATPVADAPVSATKVRAAMGTYLRDHHLGRHVLADVTTLGGRQVYSRGTGTAAPASTTKLLTTTTALELLGPAHVFTTRVVSGGPGRVVLVGGGDPLLASRPDPAGTGRSEETAAYPRRADVATLAALTAKALHARGRSRVRVGYDDSLFSGPAVNPHWPADYISTAVIAPVGALWVDEGRPADGLGRVSDPALAAAQTFAAALATHGITVTGAPRQQKADGPVLASVHSAPLSEIVEHILEVSDNEGAEVLGHQDGLAASGVGSFTAGVAAVRATLGRLGVPLAHTTLYDGSGLSRQDRLTPATLAGVLRVAASPAHPELRAVVTSLPVAGYTGSLADRFEDAPAAGRGRTRAKTGTLTGVTSLAGIATGPDGVAMIFVLMADRVPLADTLDARVAMDDAAGALGACRCG